MLFKTLKKYSQSNYSTGRVIVNEDLCTGCTKCTKICPATALEMNSKHKSQMVISANCISCGACTAVCATTAIEIDNFYYIPDGAYKTTGRIQPVGQEAYPRFFTAENPVGFTEEEKEQENDK